jgi:hypothetical protein
MSRFYFDLTTQSIEKLMLSETNAKDKCYIHNKNNKNDIYNGFILDKNSKTMIICETSFYKNKDTHRYIPRLIFRKVDNDFKQKETTISKDIIISFNDSQKALKFWILINFLKNFKDLVDSNDFEKSYKVIKNNFIAEFETKSQNDKVLEISQIIKKANISSQDIFNAILLRERQTNLEAFKGFLNNETREGQIFFELYKQKKNIQKQGEEVVWHHFLKHNDWIIGLNLDIKFISDLISEQKIGNENSEGRNSPKIDLLGKISNFTVLIELKTSNTKIFTEIKANTARSNTWNFSSNFIDGVSQCLGQKFSFDKSYEYKDFIDENGDLIDKRKIRTIDPKVIFIIGNRSQEFPLDNNQNNIIKNDTFERFRQNNKHIEIITFDELYERAKYIISQSDNIKS